MVSFCGDPPFEILAGLRARTGGNLDATGAPREPTSRKDYLGGEICSPAKSE